MVKDPADTLIITAPAELRNSDVGVFDMTIQTVSSDVTKVVRAARGAATELFCHELFSSESSQGFKQGLDFSFGLRAESV
jgi:hypothetical protein